MATFGSIPYGQSLIGELQLTPDLTMCEQIMICGPKTVSNEGPTEERRASTMFIYAQRGNCSFAQKAAMAEIWGASALIVGDTKEEDVTTVLPFNDPKSNYSPKIPVFLLSKEDGDTMLRALNKGQDILDEQDHEKVVLSLNFPLDKRDIVDFKIKVNVENINEVTELIEILNFVDKMGRDDRVAFTGVYDIRFYFGDDEMTEVKEGNQNCVPIGDGYACSNEPKSKKFF